MSQRLPTDRQEPAILSLCAMRRLMRHSLGINDESWPEDLVIYNGDWAYTKGAMEAWIDLLMDKSAVILAKAMGLALIKGHERVHDDDVQQAFAMFEDGSKNFVNRALQKDW